MKNFNSFKKTLGFLTATVLAIAETSCSNTTNESESNIQENSVSETITTDTSENTETEITETNKTTEKKNKSEKNKLFSDRDLNPDFSKIDGDIFVNGDSGKCDNSDVKIDGAKITITQEGIYRISGKLDDGQIIVDAPDAKVQIILDNADITCKDSSAIYGMNSKKIFISLAENSINKLTDGENYDDSQEPDACIFSKDSLTINGSGTLEINSSLSGIHSKDDVVITGGNININAKADGIKGKDYVAIADGIFDIKSAEDGIKSTNTNNDNSGYIYIENGSFTINSDCDGIQAETDLTIKNGTFDIISGGGSENSTKVHTDNMGFGGGGRFKPDNFGDMQPPDNFKTDNFGDMQPPDNFNPGNFGDMQPPDNFKPDNFEDMQPPDNFKPDNFEDMQPPQMQENKTDSDENMASSKGLKSGNNINISGGNININSADDSVHSSDINISSGIINIKSGDDGIHADSDIKIDNGSINIAESYEGIEGAVIEINGGNIRLKASDDGLNASDGSAQIGMGSYSSNVKIIINDGYIEVDAGGDGLDSNGDMSINGGTVIVNGSTSGGDAALDTNGEFLIKGGTVIAAGMHNMIELPSEKSEQCVISATFDTTQKADTLITLTDSDGNDIINFTSIKSFDNIVISSPDIIKGKTYIINIDGTEYESITINDTITTTGTQSDFGNFGGFGGGGRGNKGDFQPPTNENGDFEMPDKRPDRKNKNAATNL